MEDNLKAFHYGLTANPNIEGIPKSYQEFKNKMIDPSYRQKIHTFAINSPHIEGIKKDFKEFENWVMPTVQESINNLKRTIYDTQVQLATKENKEESTGFLREFLKAKDLKPHEDYFDVLREGREKMRQSAQVKQETPIDPKTTLLKAAAYSKGYTSEQIQQDLLEGGKHTKFGISLANDINEEAKRTEAVIKNGSSEEIRPILLDYKKKLVNNINNTKRLVEANEKEKKSADFREDEDVVGIKQKSQKNIDYFNSQLNDQIDNFTSLVAHVTEEANKKKDFNPILAASKEGKFEDLDKQTDTELVDNLIKTGNKLLNYSLPEKENSANLDYLEHKTQVLDIFSKDKPSNSGTFEKYGLLGARATLKSLTEDYFENANALKIEQEQLKAEIESRYNIGTKDGKKVFLGSPEEFKDYEREINNFSTQLKQKADILQKKQDLINRIKLIEESHPALAGARYSEAKKAIIDKESKNISARDAFNIQLNDFIEQAITDWSGTAAIGAKLGLIEEGTAENYIQGKIDKKYIPEHFKTSQTFNLDNGKVTWGGLNVAAYNTTKVTIQSLSIAGLASLSGGTSLAAGASLETGAGILSGIGAAGVTVASTMALTAGEMIQNQIEQGKSLSEATNIGLTQAFIEGLTEIINPIEVTGFAPKSGILGNFIGKGAFNKQAYAKLLNQTEKFLLKKGFNKNSLYAVGRVLDNIATQGAMETVEEEIGLLLNSEYDEYLRKGDPLHKGEEVNSDTVISTMVNTLITSVGLGGISSIQGFRNNPVYKSMLFDIGSSPEAFIGQLDKDLKAGKIDKATYEETKKHIEESKNIVSTNKEILDNLLDEDEKIEYVAISKNLIDSTKDLEKYTLSNNKKKITETEEAITKYTEQLSSLIDKSQIFASSTKEEKQKLISEQIQKNVEKAVPSSEIPNMGIEEIIAASNIVSSMSEGEQTPETEKILQEKTEELQKRIEELQTPEEPQAEVTEKDFVLEQINNTNDEEQLQELFSQVFQNTGLSVEDKEEIADKINDKITSLAETPVEKEVIYKDETLQYSKGDYVKHNGTAFTVESYNPETNKLILKPLSTSLGITQENVNPQDVTLSTKEEVDSILRKNLKSEKEEQSDTLKGIKEEETTETIPDKVEEIVKKELIKEIEQDDFTKLSSDQLTEEFITANQNNNTDRAESIKKEINRRDLEEKALKEKEEKETKKQEVKQAKTSRNPVINVFSTISSLKDVKDFEDIFYRVQFKVLSNIREGRLPEVFITIINNDLPLDSIHFSEKDLKYFEDKKALEKKEEGRIAILTDKNGNTLYFNEKGEIDPNGVAVHQPLRGKMIEKVKGKKELDLTGLTLPNAEELKGREDVHNRSIENLRKARTSTEKKQTFKIADISKGSRLPSKTINIPKFDKTRHKLIVNGLGVKLVNERGGVVSINSRGNFTYLTSLPKLNKIFNLLLNFSKGTLTPKERQEYIEKFLYTKKGRRFVKTESRFIVEGEQSFSFNYLKPENLGKFEFVEWDEEKQDFIKKTFPTYYDFLDEYLENIKGYQEDVRTTGNFIEIGEPVTPVKKETPKKTVVEIVGKYSKKPKEEGGLVDETLELNVRRKIAKATKEQIEKGRQWFENIYSKSSPVKFEDLSKVVNSNAFATWRDGVITLWKGGDFSHTYHEAFHDFTQMFLTPKQKSALYEEASQSELGKKAIEDYAKELGKEVKDLTEKERFFALEEMLAEDFRNYMLSDQTLILNKRVQRNTIFRKIVDYLKELFKVGNPSIETIYKNLSTGNLKKYRYNKDNQMFGKLNVKYEGFSFKDSVNLSKALDSLILKAYSDKNINLALLFKDADYINRTYITVKNSLTEAFNGSIDALNEIEQELLETTNEQQKLGLESDKLSLEATIDKLDNIIDNFNTIKIEHLQNSEFLKVSKKLVEELEIDETNPETRGSIYEDKDKESVRERTSQQIIFLIASLQKYNSEGELEYNDFLPFVPKTQDFIRTWNTLAKELSGTLDYKLQIDKIKDLGKTNESFNQLVKLLPDPNKPGATMNLLEIQLKNQFQITFSQPFVPLKYISFWKNNNGGLEITLRDAKTSNLSKIYKDWDSNIQTRQADIVLGIKEGKEEKESFFYKTDSGVMVVDLKKVISYFKDPSSFNSKLLFLKTLGIFFDEETIKNNEFKKALNQSPAIPIIIEKLNLLNSLYTGENPPTQIVEAMSKPMTSPISVLRKTYRIKVEDKFQVVFEPPIKAIEELANLEIKFGTKYFSDNVRSSEGENVWSIRPWSNLTLMLNTLNNPEIKTYTELINTTLGAYFDINKNPDADNIYLNAAFDIQKDASTGRYVGERRLDSKGKPIKVEIYNHNGLSFQSETKEEGTKTTGLTRFVKLIQDIDVLLNYGAKEVIRYGDKSTSNGVLTTFSRLSKEGVASNDHKFLPVATEAFKDTYLPVEALMIFNKMLKAALIRTNEYYTKGIGKNWEHFNKQVEKAKFGLLEGILSEETKNKIEADGAFKEDIDVRRVIIDNQKLIKRDIEKFLKNDVENIKKELNSNKLLTPKDYLTDVLYKKNLGATEEERVETAIRSFAINSYILNAEHTRFFFQDLRFYKMKLGTKSENIFEPFKRFSKNSSTGTIPIMDEQVVDYLNETALEEQKWFNTNNPEKTYPLQHSEEYKASIFEDVTMNAEDFIQEMEKIFEGTTGRDAELLAIRQAYSDATVADAFGICSWDYYKAYQIAIGKDSWTPEKDLLYKKLANRVPLTEDELLKASLFFSPIKSRQQGFSYDEATGQFIPIDFKFAVSPLIPSISDTKAFSIIRDRMLSEGVSMALFASASKHSATLMPIEVDGKTEYRHNLFYDKDGNVSKEKLHSNSFFISQQFDVVASPEDFKKKVTFSTQLRKLLSLNSYFNGVPVDYKGTKEQWEKLTEKQKQEQSKSHKIIQNFSNAIDNLVALETQKLKTKLDVKEAKDGSWVINDEKLSNLLEVEFKKRNLPYNTYKSIQIVDGKFKTSLDASLQRDLIEQIAISIVDNSLRKQKGFGEALVQVPVVGSEDLKRVNNWNGIDGSDLPFYKNQGRTLPDGTKVTSAHKIKVALQGDFKKLLYLKDVQELAKNPEVIEEAKQRGGSTTPELVALNRLLRNEEWIDKTDIRSLITTTGVRIPVQGINSMEFMEVYEFLPQEAGSIIVVSPALVAKSGGDFDWDKITTLFTSFSVDKKGNIIRYEDIKTQKIKNLFKSLSEEFGLSLKEESKDEVSTKLIAKLFDVSEEDLDNIILEEAEKEKLDNFITKKYYQNEVNLSIRQLLELPEMFEQLITPNSTYMFKETADKLKEANMKENGIDKLTISDIPKVTTSLDQFESNTVGKGALGIGAIYNTLFSLTQKAGVVLEDWYKTDVNNQAKLLTSRLPVNKIEGQISLSNIWSQEFRGTKYRISDAISQLMNGWVDVAKDDWVFYINGIKEIAPTMLYTAMTGVHKDIIMGFFTQPVIKNYIKTLQNYKSEIVKFTNPELAKDAKAKAVYDTLIDLIPDDLTYLTKIKGKYVELNVKAEFEKNYRNPEKRNFYSFIGSQLREVADEHKNSFEPELMLLYSLPNGKLERKPIITKKDKMNQMMYLIHYLELSEQSSLMDRFRRLFSQDTEKPVNLQASNQRKIQRLEFNGLGFIDSSYVNKIANDSTIKAFTSSEKGIDKVLGNVTKNLFEITNHQVFNNFLFDRFTAPSKDRYDKKGNLIAKGSNIPFDKKFDMYEDWVKSVKNEFILYLYQNYVYEENSSTRTSEEVFKQMLPNTALALEIENLQRSQPKSVKQHPLLQNLVRENVVDKITKKVTLVNLKIKEDIADDTISNIYTEDFESLLNSEDQTIRELALKIAKFAYVQSGATASPISFYRIIPEEVYISDMDNIVKEVQNIFDTDPAKSKEIILDFYKIFQRYHKQFYESYQLEVDGELLYDNDGEPIYDIDFIKDGYRKRNYLAGKSVEILGKKQEADIKRLEKANKKVKEVSSITEEVFTKETANNNPTTLFVGNGSLFSLIDSSKNTNPLFKSDAENTAILPIRTANRITSDWVDKDLSKNKVEIDLALEEIKNKFLNNNYKKIVFEQALFDYSDLSINAPNTYNYVISKIYDIFGVKFNEMNEETVTPDEAIMETIPDNEISTYEEDSEITKKETTEDIYSKLGNKTKSENVVIDEVQGRKPAVESNNKELTIVDKLKQFTNKHNLPFNWKQFQTNIFTPLEIFNRFFQEGLQFAQNEEQERQIYPKYYGLDDKGLSITVEKESSNKWYLSSLYLPKFMQNKGMGKDIVDILKYIAATSKSDKTIYIWSEKEAVGFWEKQGFKKTGEQITNSDQHLFDKNLPPFEVMEINIKGNQSKEVQSSKPIVAYRTRGNNFLEALEQDNAIGNPWNYLGRGQNENLTKKNLFTVKPIQSVDKKAVVKASVSTQYIGFGEGIANSSTELYRQQVNEEYTKALKEANARPSTTNIPQNLQSGVEQYGTVQYANEETQKALGKNVTSIEMIESGFRNRTTRTDKELEKYNIKVGSYIKMFGKDQFGNTKNIIVKITKITKGYDEVNWYKEGWTQEGLQKLKNHTNSANAVEFQVIKPANSGNYSSNDVIFVSIGGKRGSEVVRKEQQDKTIKEAIKAIEAGATLITDNKSYVESSDYNEGEKRLAKNLQFKGYSYSEQTIDGQVLGIWKKQQESKNQYGLYKTNTVKEAVEEFIAWMIGEKHTDKLQDYRQAIIDKIENGELKGKQILYYKDIKEPSHATALDYLINKYDWSKNSINISIYEEEFKDIITEDVKNDKYFEFKDGTVVSIPFELNEEQKQALYSLEDFANNPKNYNNQITLLGFAGTGKTTLISIYDKYLKNKYIYPYYSSPTHRANAVTKLKNPNAKVLTLHSLFGLSGVFNIEDGDYDLKDLMFAKQNRPKIVRGDFLIVDESSMVSDSLYEFLNSYKSSLNISIVYVGDPAQLKPVKQDKISKVFNEGKQIQLTKVERTGNNPILEESTNLRNNKDFNYQTKIIGDNGVEYLETQQETRKAVAESFNSKEFKNNKLYFRILSAKNMQVEQSNSIVRELLFNTNKQLVKNDILMGYDNFDIDYKTKEPKIINSGDYQVIDLTESYKTIYINNTPIDYKGYNVVLENLLNKEDTLKSIFVVDNEENTDKIFMFTDKISDLNIKGQQALNSGDRSLSAKYFQEARDLQAQLAFMKSIVDSKGKVKVKKTLDYGYAHTIHKSQGGTYNKVLILADTITKPFDVETQQQLKYVAMSRASEFVFVQTNKELKPPIIKSTESNEIKVTPEDINNLPDLPCQ